MDCSTFEQWARKFARKLGIRRTLLRLETLEDRSLLSVTPVPVIEAPDAASIQIVSDDTPVLTEDTSFLTDDTSVLTDDTSVVTDDTVLSDDVVKWDMPTFEGGFDESIFWCFAGGIAGDGSDVPAEDWSDVPVLDDGSEFNPDLAIYCSLPPEAAYRSLDGEFGDGEGLMFTCDEPGDAPPIHVMYYSFMAPGETPDGSLLDATSNTVQVDDTPLPSDDSAAVNPVDTLVVDEAFVDPSIFWMASSSFGPEVSAAPQDNPVEPAVSQAPPEVKQLTFELLPPVATKKTEATTNQLQTPATKKDGAFSLDLTAQVNASHSNQSGTTDSGTSAESKETPTDTSFTLGQDVKFEIAVS